MILVINFLNNHFQYSYCWFPIVLYCSFIYIRINLLLKSDYSWTIITITITTLGLSLIYNLQLLTLMFHYLSAFYLFVYSFFSFLVFNLLFRLWVDLGDHKNNWAIHYSSSTVDFLMNYFTLWLHKFLGYLLFQVQVPYESFHIIPSFVAVFE